MCYGTIIDGGYCPYENNTTGDCKKPIGIKCLEQEWDEYKESEENCDGM